MIRASSCGMARGPRIDFPGAFHHVYARGIEKRVIFTDDEDREELRRRIRFNLERFGASCLAWAFLPNHFHLLFQSEDGILSRFMHCLMSGYSLYFNGRHDRVGHLFQNRFRSVPVQSEPYLLELLRYIHLNPLRAGVVGTVEELAEYRWSGHREIIRSSVPPWRDFPLLFEFFHGGDREGTLTNYRKFLEDGLRSDPTVAFSDGPEPDEEAAPAGWEIPPMPDGQEDSYREFLRAVSRACRKRGISPEELRAGRGDRASSHARRQILKDCVVERGMDRHIVCSWLGITDAGGAYLLRSPPRRGRFPDARTGEDGLRSAILPGSPRSS